MNVKFIDLFAGMGGTKIGFINGFKQHGFTPECVMTSEIKKHAIDVQKQNFPTDNFVGDISLVESKDIPDFDFMTAGFPCQAFSIAGKRQGFHDTRGTMFFQIERILRDKKPFGFILENVDGLVRHDLEHKNDKIGRTFKVILEILNELGYHVSWNILNSLHFGVPQERKRIIIVGTKTSKVDLTDYKPVFKSLEDIMDKGQPTLQTPFVKNLIKKYGMDHLIGKCIKDKRAGDNNIHSWDAEIFGPVSKDQKKFLDMMVLERRKTEYGKELGIEPMEGMPLNLEQIRRFFNHPKLEKLLADLVKKKYLFKQKPKDMIKEKTNFGTRKYRQVAEGLEEGYSIICGNFNFEVTRIMDPKKHAPTFTTIGADKNVVPDGDGLRPLTLREGLRIFGYPEDYKFDISFNKGMDLLGNTLVVSVIEYAANKVAIEYQKYQNGLVQVSAAEKIDYENKENQLSLFQ